MAIDDRRRGPRSNPRNDTGNYNADEIAIYHLAWNAAAEACE